MGGGWGRVPLRGVAFVSASCHLLVVSHVISRLDMTPNQELVGCMYGGGQGRFSWRGHSQATAAGKGYKVATCMARVVWRVCSRFAIHAESACSRKQIGSQNTAFKLRTRAAFCRTSWREIVAVRRGVDDHTRELESSCSPLCICTLLQVSHGIHAHGRSGQGGAERLGPPCQQLATEDRPHS